MTHHVFTDLLTAGTLPLPAEAKKMAAEFSKSVKACDEAQHKMAKAIEEIRTLKDHGKKHAHKALVLCEMLYDEYKDHPEVVAALEAAQQPVDEIPQPVVAATGLKVAKGHKKAK